MFKKSAAIAVQAFAIYVSLFLGDAIAQVSDESLKLAVLDDMSGPYAENSGQGNVLAARMAIMDFGGCTQMVRHRSCRRNSRNGKFGRRAGSSKAGAREKQDHLGDHSGDGGADRKGVFAELGALGLRHLFACKRSGNRGGPARRPELVLHHRRLCLRTRARGQRRLFRQIARRNSFGCRQTSDRIVGLQLLLIASTKLEGGNHRRR